MKNYFIVDLWVDKNKNFPYLSNTLLTKIEENLEIGKKTILYINKRWAYDLQICQDCNDIKKCPRCDISLSVHKNPAKLVCHHCSYSEDFSPACQKCGSVEIKNIWVGTEQIEENLKKYFQDISIFRMDSDNVANLTEKKQALENIKNAQIIIWTKMITTGFDLKNIGVIGIILLEQELQIPRYDTEEKIYQNIKQLIWRWWRIWEETDIIIQTMIPKNEMIQNIVELNYKDFFKKVLEERKIFHYPPFVELATLRYKDINKIVSIEYINTLKNTLDSFNTWDFEIIKIDTPLKRDNQFFTKIIIKWIGIRNFLQNIKKELLKNKDLVVIFE